MSSTTIICISAVAIAGFALIGLVFYLEHRSYVEWVKAVTGAEE